MAADFLDELPVSWHLVQLKSVAKEPIKNGVGEPGTHDNVSWPRYIRITDIASPRTLKTDTFASLPPETAAAAPLRVGDILFAAVGASYGKSYFHTEDIGAACFAGFMVRFSASERILPEYVAYWSESAHYWAQVESRVVQATIQNFSASKYGALTVPVPPIEDQRAITAFLDRETAKIDALVAEQRRLMDLLREQRQAVISHAVTKGINPAAPMKDSGVEWLGQVPAHWTFGRVKTWLRTTSGGTPNTAQQEIYYTSEDAGVPWIRTTDLVNGPVNVAEVFITQRALQDTACTVLPAGTVLVAMYGGDGTVGKNGMLTFPAAINQAVCGLLPSEDFNMEFLLRYMQFFRPYWMIGAESSRKDPNISQERVRECPILHPPRVEQDAIAKWIETEVGRVDGLLSECEAAIQLLGERRAALITAAVTGQFDVRGLALSEAA